MIGTTTKRQSMHGGSNDFHSAFSYMMLYVLIISVVSMNIIPFHMAIRLR